MRFNRFVFLNRPMLSLEAHLGVIASPQAPFPADFVTLPVSASHRRFGSFPLATEKRRAPVAGRTGSNVADPYLVGLGHGEVAIQQVRHNRQAMSAVCGRDPETALAAGANAVLLHQLLYPLLAHANALSPQLPPDPRPAIGSAIRRIHGTNMHQQRLITQMATLNLTTPAN